jgi:hypothetical protein
MLVPQLYIIDLSSPFYNKLGLIGPSSIWHNLKSSFYITDINQPSGSIIPD